jgi:hypothetical protein
VEGRPCLGVALSEFREDSGKLAPEVALVFVDLAWLLRIHRQPACALRIDQAKPPDRAARPCTFEQAPDDARQKLGSFASFNLPSILRSTIFLYYTP